MKRSGLKILLIEDDPVYTSLLKTLLANDDLEITGANILAGGLALAAGSRFDVCLLDLNVPDSHGLDTLRNFQRAQPDLPVVILSGLADEQLAAQAVQAGAQDYLLKGSYLTQGEAGRNLLVRSLWYAVERHEIYQAMMDERNQLEERVAERTAELRQLNYSLHALREIDRASLAARSPEEIAQIALTRFWRLVPYHRADVLIFAGSTHEVLLITGLADGMVRTERLELDPLPFFEHTALQNGQALVFECPGSHPPRPFCDIYAREQICSSFFVPLAVEGHLIGVIAMGALQADAFNDTHIEKTLSLGSQLSLLVYNAQLFRQVQSANENLRALTSRLVSAQENERKRISLELHDEAGQTLTALKLSLSMLRTDIPDKFPQLQSQVDESIHLTESTLEMLRSLAHDLRPPALEAVGLDQTMRDLCQRVSKQTGLRVHYRGAQLAVIPGHIQVSLYRVLQEALTNVIKHAQAHSVRVHLKGSRRQISLSVRDDGVGFGPRQPDTQARSNGIGLIGIQERMQALGGRLSLETRPGAGTHLMVQIPLDEAI